MYKDQIIVPIQESRLSTGFIPTKQKLTPGAPISHFMVFRLKITTYSPHGKNRSGMWISDNYNFTIFKSIRTIKRHHQKNQQTILPDEE
jgi:hypothetical protein